MNMRIWSMVLACVLVLSGRVAVAQSGSEPGASEAVPDHPALRDPFFIAIGAYSPRSATSALLGPSGGGSGVGIDFEDTLGLAERKVTPAALVRWRFAEHWRLELEYFDLKRGASRALDVDVTWGDNTYADGTVVDSEFDIADTRLAVGYSFFKRKDKELGVGLGLHVTEMTANVDAAGVGNSASDVLAPLPVVNLYGLFALTDEWALAVRADWLSLSSGDYSGDIRSIGIDVMYQPFRNVGFGLGSRSLTVDVEIDSTDWHGTANLAFQGPQAFVSVSF